MSIGSQSHSLLVELPGCTQTAHNHEEKAIKRIARSIQEVITATRLALGDTDAYMEKVGGVEEDHDSQRFLLTRCLG
jgi:hypothetical protein